MHFDKSKCFNKTFYLNISIHSFLKDGTISLVLNLNDSINFTNINLLFKMILCLKIYAFDKFKEDFEFNFIHLHCISYKKPKFNLT